MKKIIDKDKLYEDWIQFFHKHWGLVLIAGSGLYLSFILSVPAFQHKIEKEIEETEKTIKESKVLKINKTTTYIDLNNDGIYKKSDDARLVLSNEKFKDKPFHQDVFLSKILKVDDKLLIDNIKPNRIYPYSVVKSVNGVQVPELLEQSKSMTPQLPPKENTQPNTTLEKVIDKFFKILGVPESNTIPPFATQKPSNLPNQPKQDSGDMNGENSHKNSIPPQSLPNMDNQR